MNVRGVFCAAITVPTAVAALSCVRLNPAPYNDGPLVGASLRDVRLKGAFALAN